MRTATKAVGPHPPARPSRSGYDRRWWGEAGRADLNSSPYWAVTRRPAPCLAFVIPILLVYEIGVAWLGAEHAALYRTGIDGWFRASLETLGHSESWLPPAVLLGALLAWQSADRQPWRFPAGTLVGMLCESMILAVALMGMSRLVDLGVAHVEGSSALVSQVGAAVPRHASGRALSFLGAGVYEEAVFRLLLLPACYGLLRLMLVPGVLAGVLAITGSSLLFSMAHHVGAPGETFTWYAFVFRWFAGVYFAWAFVVRGFGVAVGTHVLYDCLVGLSQPPV